MADNPFNPTDSAAMLTKSVPLKKQIKPQELAAMPPGFKNKPIILPPKPAKTGFPANDDPYWKNHPLQTEHQDGTVRMWGEEAKTPYTLPKQLLPPPSTGEQPSNKPTKELSDKAKGYSSNYYTPNH